MKKNNSKGGGKITKTTKGKTRTLKFSVDKSKLKNTSNRISGLKLTTPIPFDENLAQEFDNYPREVVFNGNAYEATVHGLTKNGQLITEDGYIHDLKVLSVNGVDKLIYSDSSGIHLLDEKTIPYTHQPVGFFTCYFNVVDLNKDGNDDLIYVMNATDGAKIIGVDNFSTNPLEQTHLLSDFRTPADIIGVTEEGGIIFQNGVPDLVDPVSTHPYGISFVVEGIAITTEEMVMALSVQFQDNNPNVIVFDFSLEGDGETFKEHYLKVQVLDENGEYTGYGVGNVKTGDKYMLYRYLSEDENGNPVQSGIPVGNYILRFTHLRYNNQPIDLSFTVE